MRKLVNFAIWTLVLAFTTIAAVGCTTAQKKPVPNQNQNQQINPNQNDNFGGQDQDVPMVPDNPNEGLDEKDLPGDIDRDRR